MKISDLLTEDFDINQFVMDIINMFKANKVPKTNINNIIKLGKRRGVTYLTPESLTVMLTDMGYTVEGDILFIDDSIASDGDIPPDIPDDEKYDPVSDLAKNAGKESIK